jgi:tetratricopeptide (TPR) repeat protein
LIVNEAGRLIDRVPYLNSLSVLAACLSDSGRYEEAGRFFAASEREAEELAKDSENLKNQVILAEILNNHGLCLNSQERYKEADGLYRRASGIYKKIYETSGSVSSGTTYAVSLLNTGENAFKAGDYKETDGLFKEGLGIFEALLDELDDYDLAQYYTWLSYHRLINEHDPEGALEASVRALELQPGSVLANMNYGYACLYSGHYEECDRVLTAVADLGEGQATMIIRDLEAQGKAGLFSSHTEVLKGIIIR